MPGEIHIPTPPAFRRHLKELAERRGQTLAQTIRSAVMETSDPEYPSAVPTEGEVLVLLGEAARAGSVPAMREPRAYWRKRRGEGHSDDPLAAFDELAVQRGKRIGPAPR